VAREARDLQNIRRESMAFKYIDEEGGFLDNENPNSADFYQ
jgi:hypothetical protein